MARATATVGYACLVCRATGYNWHDLGFVPAPHSDHDDFLVRCNPCRIVFPTARSLETHFRIHTTLHPGSEAPPNSPTFPTTIKGTPMSSPEDRNLLCSGPSTAPPDQRSDVSSLPPGQHPPPYTSTQAPAEPVHLRQLLLDATSHLVWLAASAARQLSVQPDMTLMSFVRQTTWLSLRPCQIQTLTSASAWLLTSQLRLLLLPTCPYRTLPACSCQYMSDGCYTHVTLNAIKRTVRTRIQNKIMFK